MHLDDERMQRLLHEELAPPARAVALEHLATCDSCRTRFDDESRMEARLFATLQAIDTPAPLRLLDLDSRPRSGRRWLARLAAIGGLTIAGIAFAAPGSPLAGLLRRVTQSTRTVTAPSPSRAAESEANAGIAVAPGRRLTIDVAAGGGTAVATISLTDSGEVVVRAVGGRPSFTSGVDRVAIRNVDGITALFIDIPRTAPYVEVHVERARVLVKRGLEVTTTGRLDDTGRYLVPLGP